MIDVYIIGTEKEYLSNMKAASKETAKNKPDSRYLKQLIRESHAWRRDEVEKMNKEGLPMVSTILKDWPCLKYGINVG